MVQCGSLDSKEEERQCQILEENEREVEGQVSPDHYLQDNFLMLRNLKEGTKSMEEYTIEFKQLLLNCERR